MISLFNNKTEWHSDLEDELFDYFGKHCNGQSEVFGFEKWQLSDLGQRRWRCTPSVYQLQPAQLSTSESQLVTRILLRVMAKIHKIQTKRKIHKIQPRRKTPNRLNYGFSDGTTPIKNFN